ncbi:ImmA/IrrE family metallo-endopeptidase [Pelagicoccus enzymogenes]|uniref:ImmA/IrrE family metallo-endopeptidase n=1 Tax=Pelagicoccus enzymogenes TaxID=2773457 RepID=UPI00280CD3D3|nr:ImmA/IrrE family metallo-endopeptidase [Pelagicoccus enzymogenes]MDQ8198193.1 ImmA/IrrE family metallo-endopeptidase [Pelagicoccus enzymogenes]
MKAKLIKTESDYEAALERIEEIFDARPGTHEGDELELLVTLVEMYEAKAFPIDLPDPLAAIHFRMEQQGLKPVDLVPYIGSRPKVSEVLSGKRPLSLSMIRKLTTGLGIPAEVLLKEPNAELPSEDTLSYARHFPIAEMLKRGWFGDFDGTAAEAKSQLEDLLVDFAGPLGRDAMLASLNRQQVRQGSKQDDHALAAWRIRVATLALKEPLPAFKPGTVTEEFLSELARLSYLSQGPQLAKEFLAKNGIHLVCERHLKKTHLDGAALKLPNGAPVVALTLRYDRLDNFWFTLFHELAHVALHLDQDDVEAFFDDLTESTNDRCEKEADTLAANALIPQREWKKARLTSKSSPASVVAFAEKLRISPSIPAGRLRYESGDYTKFKQLVGQKKVRCLFE